MTKMQNGKQAISTLLPPMGRNQEHQQED